MDLARLVKGKREADEAVETEVASAKKQKVEETVNEIETVTVEVEKEIETDSYCSKPDQLIKVEASGLDGHVVSVLADKSNVLEEDSGEAENKPVVASKEGHTVVAFEIDEPNDDADSCLQDKISMNVDIAAAIEAPASLTEEDHAAASKKKDESSYGFDSFSADAAFLEKDVTAANLSPTAPITKKLVSIQNKVDSGSHEFDSTHETNNDDNVDTAEKAPPGPTEKGPLVASEEKDDSFSDNDRPNRVTAESNSSFFTMQEDETNKELEELDDDTSSSDDDVTHVSPRPLTPPTEQRSGGKTLFLGNLSFSVEREDVEQFFKAAGEIVNIRFAMNSDETFRGYGYVDFASAEAAEKALCELNGKELLRRRVRLGLLRDRRLFTPYTGGQDIESSEKGGKAQGQTVFVRGFNKSGCQDEIRRSLEEHFGSCGEIAKVSCPKDQDGCVRGIAFIDFKDRNGFIKALALNGCEFRDGILSVKEAKPTGDSRDGVGCDRGYGRTGGTYNWQESRGRSGLFNFCGRSGLSDVRGRSVLSDFHGRSGRSDFCGRNGLSDFSGRSSWSDNCGRGGMSDFQGSIGRSDFGRGGRSHFRGSVGRSDFGRGGRSDFNGRGGQANSYGRGGQADSYGRGGRSDFNGRGGQADSYGRGGQSDFHGTGGWSVFRGRGATSDYHARSGQFDFRGRGGRSNFHERGGWTDFYGRGGRSNFHGGGDVSNFQGRGGRIDFNGRGRSDFHGGGGRTDFQGRGGRSNYQQGGDWSNFQGRGGRTDFRTRSFHETGILYGAGVWQGSNGRGAWRDFSGSGILGSLNGTNNVGGSGTLNKPNIAAPGAGNNTTCNQEGKLEDRMN